MGRGALFGTTWYHTSAVGAADGLQKSASSRGEKFNVVAASHHDQVAVVGEGNQGLIPKTKKMVPKALARKRMHNHPRLQAWGLGAYVVGVGVVLVASQEVAVFIQLPANAAACGGGRNEPKQCEWEQESKAPPSRLENRRTRGHAAAKCRLWRRWRPGASPG